MKPSSCQICGVKLTDPKSIADGVGPDCAGKRGLFYTACGTSAEEIANLESAGDAAARWIRNFRQDMRAGRIRQARQCIEAARRKAADTQSVLNRTVENVSVYLNQEAGTSLAPIVLSAL